MANKVEEYILKCCLVFEKKPQWTEILSLKELKQGPIQDGEVSEARDAPSVWRDNALGLLVTRVTGP